MKFWNKKHNRSNIGVVWLLLVITLTSCTQKKDKLPLTVGITHSFIGDAAVYVAKSQRYFEKEGLDLHLVENPSGARSLDMLDHDQVDIAHVSETPLIISLLKREPNGDFSNSPYRILANMFRSESVQCILLRSEAFDNFEEPIDLEDKNIGLKKGTQLEFFWDAFLLEQGIDTVNFDIADIAPGDQIEAFKQGKIDVAVLWEPHASALKNDSTLSVFRIRTKLDYSTLWMAVINQSTVEQKDVAIIRYLRALSKAQDYIKNNPEGSAEILAKSTGIAKPVISDLIRSIIFDLTLGLELSQKMEEELYWYASTEKIQMGPIKLDSLIYTNYLEEINPDGITWID